MGRVRRKLTSRRGASAAFALVVFMILAIFSANMLEMSLNALESSVLLRNGEKARTCANAAARFIRSSLNAAPDMDFTTHWSSAFGDEIVKKILAEALNKGRVELVWSVEGDSAEAEAAFVDVPLSVTARHCKADDLEKYFNEDGGYEDPAYLPTIEIRFCHRDYKMTMVITAESVARNGSGYAVKFADSGIETYLGAS